MVDRWIRGAEPPPASTQGRTVPDQTWAAKEGPIGPVDRKKRQAIIGR
jgi:hypothetical protein